MVLDFTFKLNSYITFKWKLPWFLFYNNLNLNIYTPLQIPWHRIFCKHIMFLYILIIVDTKLKTYSIYMATDIETITSKSFHFSKRLPYIINEVDGNLDLIAISIC